MTRALVHCHQMKVLHLGVMPANVLVTSKGICKLPCSLSIANSGTPVGSKAFLVGTPGYQAPELLLGKSPAAACDVYSLGILLWQLDSRKVPYAGQHPQVFEKQMPLFVACMLVTRLVENNIIRPPLLRELSFGCQTSPFSSCTAGRRCRSTGPLWT